MSRLWNILFDGMFDGNVRWNVQWHATQVTKPCRRRVIGEAHVEPCRNRAIQPRRPTDQYMVAVALDVALTVALTVALAAELAVGL